MSVTANEAIAVAKAFAAARHSAWDDADVAASPRTIDEASCWSVTTTGSLVSSATDYETPIDPPYVDYLIDRETGACIGIGNHRMVHRLPEPWSIGD